MKNFKLSSESLVIDVGSNDGTLLKEFKKFRLKVIGIEPAVNIAKIAEENGIKTKDLKGCKKSLYRLPELLHGISYNIPIFLVEKEQ